MYLAFFGREASKKQTIERGRRDIIEIKVAVTWGPKEWYWLRSFTIFQNSYWPFPALILSDSELHTTQTSRKLTMGPASAGLAPDAFLTNVRSEVGQEGTP